ncbi:helix-turn-helix domain-containing protein [Cronobacter sakazakii]|uniref:helix-turn-helix domain-containing protein n=1 Tax=Cronobacter sakazakii TaxID=28141 RepID=UPI0009B95DB2|nr:helix-turn-helix domain-containing protein [Cronobacter sakazakii]EGT0039579.1 helix-turn-helix domain-containing protein [Cronobacter sakazakii]EKK3999852.1 helix-turn-helix domain-containing protein [Cronobacter sakazakii]EKK7675995.1 helix-turn-helix domain-containing protein [Cronobacter sakazakii]ELY4122438.1 helix-turn-helix domain-containing protein [Cronobacter sakazakii]ELY5994524.1 helix-turn-helix domain-containing protein [Cronobacter sakazakii]
MKTTLSQRLEIAMTAGGFSQASLAEAAGVSQPTVWKIVSGRTQSSAKIVDLAKALGVRPEWLAHGVGSMKSEQVETSNASSIVYEGTIALPLYDESEKQIGLTIVPDAINHEKSKAYKLNYETGFPELPQGCTIVVDSEETPVNNDFVYAKINGKSSAYRYLTRGPQNYLDVGDSRLGLVPIDERVEILGVIVFMARSFRR